MNLVYQKMSTIIRCQYLVRNTFKSIYNVNQMHFLSITTLLKDWLQGKQLLTFSQFLTITSSQIHLRLLFKGRFQDFRGFESINLIRAHSIGVCKIMKNFDYDIMRWEIMIFLRPPKRECSVQEAVCLIMTELRLQKRFPKVMFGNSNLLECR